MDDIINKPFKCEFCPKSFKLNCTLKTHIRTHTGERPFQCDVCHKMFTQSGHLKEHSRTHTGEKPYQCAQCGKSYVNGSHLRVHARSHTLERPHACPQCSDTFAHLHALKVHLSTKHGGRAYRSYVPPDGKSAVKRFFCGVCGSSFRLSHSLKVHLRSHSGDRPYKCELCAKAFTQASHLQSHLSTHSSAGTHKCSVCGRQCGSALLARRHARSHTPDYRTYRCSACGERFHKLARLKTHARRHTGEKAYKCGVCSRSFSLPALLVSHMRTHSGEKPFQCEVCSKCFAQRSVLACHLRMHKGDKRYVCDICTKKFISQSDLVKHRRIHTGEKPYKCEFCNSCFGRSNHLTRHMKIHFRSKKPQDSNTLNNRECKYDNAINDGSNVANKSIEDAPSFSRINAFNNYFENGTSVINCRPLLNCQNAATDFQHFPNLHNRFLSNIGNSSALDGYIISDGAAELEHDYNKQRLNNMAANNLVYEHNNRFTTEFLKYQSEAYEFCKQNNLNAEHRNHFEERNECVNYAGYKNADEHILRNHYDHAQGIYPRLENIYRAEKLPETSFDVKEKSSCKWRYPNTGIHLKNSCKEDDLKMADNCKPWQCGICDTGFSQKKELMEHVSEHKSSMPRVKYTKLITNPESGILEEKEIVPREKLKIVPKELLQPILNNYFTNRNIFPEKKGNVNLLPQENIKIIEDEKVCNANVEVEKFNFTQSIESELKLGTAFNLITDNITRPDERVFELGTKLNFIAGNTISETNEYENVENSMMEIDVEKESIISVDETFEPLDEDSLDIETNFMDNEDSNHSDAARFVDTKNETKEIARINSVENPSQIIIKSPKKGAVSKSKKLQESDSKKEMNVQSGISTKGKTSSKGLKEYPCTECGKVFRYSHALKVHFRLHTGQRPYACSECPKTFTQAGQLREHGKTHAGERRFQCQHCGKAFINSTHLKSHMKTHTGEKPYSCDICHKKFAHLVGWKLHQNIHTGDTPYKCEVCGKGFRQPSSLRSHQLTHTGERPYHCATCGASFAQYSTLASHRLTHRSGPDHAGNGGKAAPSQRAPVVKKFSCLKHGCEKVFSRKAHLKRHMDTHRIVSDTIT